MIFDLLHLREKLIRKIAQQTNTERLLINRHPFSAVMLSLFYHPFKRVILNELYYKGLIDLHGDIYLFIQSKNKSDLQSINIAASLTEKGRSFYQNNLPSI